MKLTLFFISSIFFLVLSSCKFSDTNQSKKVINLNENIQQVIKYSYFVDSISYIPLETNDSCLISKVKDIQLADSFIFVLDQKQSVIFIFNRQGKYLNKIDRQGQGPGEYGWIVQFYYNQSRNSISVCTASGSCKVIEYNLKGDPINEFYNDYYVGDIYQFDNGDYLLSRTGRTDDPSFSIIHSDSRGKILQKLLSRNPLYAIDSSDNWEFEIYDNTVNFISPQLDNIIYRHDGNSLRKTISLNITPTPTKEFYKTRSDVLGLGPYFFRTIYKESSKWIYLTYYSVEKGLRVLLYNKMTHHYIIGKDTQNDIDNKEFVSQTSASENNTFTYCVKGDNEDNNPMIQILHLK